jgi:hypothetical protein
MLKRESFSKICPAWHVLAEAFLPIPLLGKSILVRQSLLRNTILPQHYRGSIRPSPMMRYILI